LPTFELPAVGLATLKLPPLKVLALLLLFALSWLIALPAGATSPTTVTPTDDCVEVDHFPAEPIDNAPSKAILYFTVPPEFGGWEVAVLVDGASGEVEGGGTVADDGLGAVEIPLNAYGTHEVQEALMSLGAELVGVELLPGGFTVDAAEPVCDPASLTRAASTPTTTAATTTTTGAPPTTTTAAPTTTTSASTAPFVVENEVPTASRVVTIPWGWIGLGVGLPLLLFGLWLLVGSGRDCERLRREWEALQRQYDQIREAFDKAMAHLEERRAVRAEIEAEMAGIERTGSMGGSLEGSTRFRLIPEGKVTEEGYDAILKTVRDQLESARDGERMAEESVEEWRRQLEDAAARADSARRAYEECMGKAVAGLTPPSEDSTATGGGPMVATAQDPSGCPEGTREARPLAAPRKFRLYVDFAVIVEVEEGSERNVQTGEDLAISLGQHGLELATLGTLLGARGAGGNIASGVTGLGTGSYVKGTMGIARGTVEGLLAVKGNLGTASFPIPVPTSPEEVLVGLLQVTAQLGALVAGKVTEWMKMNQIYRVRSSLLYQEVSVQPIQIWECRAGQWVCVERVLQYDVSRLERQPGASQSFRIEGDVSQHQFESYINGATARAKQTIEASARALVEFEQSNAPGPCS
jgi:hypothetical protein